MHQEHCQDGIPPKPPDINSLQSNNNSTASFKDKLLANGENETFSISTPLSYLSPTDMDTNEIEDEKFCENPEEEIKVPISGEDKQQSFPLIDLGEQYFIVKFNKEENLETVLQKGPWFVFGHFLSVQRWEPNFVPAMAKQVLTAIWIRLPNLPTEFYDLEIVGKVGNTIGRLLKVDACTSAALRGRYARLCIELPLRKPVKSNAWIGNHKQQILYEGENLLCKNCGCLGHIARQCTTKLKETTTITPMNNTGDKDQTCHDKQNSPKEKEEWKTVSFKQRRKANPTPTKGTGSSNGAGINVNIFDANTGKFLTTQVFNYKSRSYNHNSTEGLTGKPMSKEHNPSSNNNVQTTNPFRALMEQNLVLEKTTNLQKGNESGTTQTSNSYTLSNTSARHVSNSITNATPNNHNPCTNTVTHPNQPININNLTMHEAKDPKHLYEKHDTPPSSGQCHQTRKPSPILFLT
ncbi:PREDICTED: uncharacterized protein LOC109216017 [Nicotiana attenuata]|uniref:uncharacterized protein LOC109216017 n=1 Tax=Nicotiana attenuata TaxID=49451 RepID=UPI0009058FF0|nr:PREDICTED: uncharacterized protein LOC109216017 [Nicotiana attenuata]